MATTATRLLDNYIAGRWTPATAATDELDVTNPATGEVLARVPLSGSADLDAAVQAARDALGPWREVSTIGRARKLFELRERLVARHEELARSVTTTDPAMHRWPAAPNAEPMMPLTVSSTTASGMTTMWFFAPPSA